MEEGGGVVVVERGQGAGVSVGRGEIGGVRGGTRGESGGKGDRGVGVFGADFAGRFVAV